MTIRIPLPKNITDNHPDYAYWSGLSDILSKALAYKRVSIENIKKYYKTFATLDEQGKRKYLVAVNKQLEEVISRAETALRIQDIQILEDKIVWMVNKFPSSMHMLVYEYLATGEVPYPDFFRDLEIAVKYEKELSQTDYDNVSVYNAINELKDYSLRLDNTNARSQTQNSKPLTQEQLNSLLQSTSKIRENLDDTPEYGYNDLINQTEKENNPAKMVNRNLNISNLVSNDEVRKLTKTRKTQTSLTPQPSQTPQSILRSVSLIGNSATNTEPVLQPLSQDQIDKLKNTKKI